MHHGSLLRASFFVACFALEIGCGQSSDGASSGGAGSSTDPTSATPDGGSATRPSNTSGDDAGVSSKDSGASKGGTDAGSTTTDAGVSTPIDAGPPPNDPFDASSCPGPAMTYAQAIAKFAPGASLVSLGTYTLMARTRTCDDLTGCSAWGTPTPASAPPPHGYDTGSFALLGHFELTTEGGKINARPFDDTCADTASYCYVDGAFVSPETTGTLTFPTMPAYAYVAEDIFLIPPQPDTEALDQTYTLTLTDSCAQVQSADTTPKGKATVAYGLLVRF